ncbi:hypothetical protein BV96_02271 [Sphingomonas paucimobilis]|nr:hypothetical protein BV96_02271 [Sphingomonas paucimobilis]
MTVMIGLPLSPMAVSATPTNREKTTICKMEFSAIAPTMEVGKTCRTKSLKLSASVFTPDSAPDRTRFSPSPGAKKLTKMRPSVSEIRLAMMNQASARPPIRPSAALSPIWAMPATSVEKTSGAMIILIR